MASYMELRDNTVAVTGASVAGACGSMGQDSGDVIEECASLTPLVAQ